MNKPFTLNNISNLPVIENREKLSEMLINKKAERESNPIRKNNELLYKRNFNKLMKNSVCISARTFWSIYKRISYSSCSLFSKWKIILNEYKPYLAKQNIDLDINEYTENILILIVILNLNKIDLMFVIFVFKKRDILKV